MLVLITGGSGSGKSEYAENLAMSLGEKRIYIATMMALDEEGRRRVRRHQAMREPKGFTTVECPLNLASAADSRALSGAVVLLECMSNLVANEMFSEENPNPSGAGTAEKVLDAVCRIKERCAHLVVVTNEVFSDGTVYDPETERYLKTLGMINVRLASWADRVTEVVCGIGIDYPYTDNNAGT